MNSITTQTFIQPMDVSSLLHVDIEELVPMEHEIPEEFKHEGNAWVVWQVTWMYQGLDRHPIPNPGIDLGKAMAHLKKIQCSWRISHHHKCAAVAYLASLWFSSPNGERS